MNFSVLHSSSYHLSLHHITHIAHILDAAGCCQGGQQGSCPPKIVVSVFICLVVSSQGTSTEAGYYFNPIDLNQLPKKRLSKESKVRTYFYFFSYWIQALKEVFARSLADHGDNETETSRLCMTRACMILCFAKMVWKSR